MSHEKIISIEEFEGLKRGYSHFDGYKIKTSAQTIEVGISNGQSCCEDWGYFISEEDVSQYLGASLISVDIVDTSFNVEELKEMYVYVDSCMFINFQTSSGTFQLTVYNEHNGYYGHSVYVKSRQVSYESDL